MGKHGAGLYIVVEGGETSGKSTLSFELARHYRATLTRETGGTSVGAQIRNILHDVGNSALFPLTEALLTGADRAQHILEVVKLNLDAGRDVVSDRSWVSTVVYQAMARDIDPSDVLRITEIAVGRYKEMDELIVLDIPWNEYLARQLKKGRTDRFEAMEADFHRKVLSGYRTLAHDLGATVIDACLTPKEIFVIATDGIDKKRPGQHEV